MYIYIYMYIHICIFGEGRSGLRGSKSFFSSISNGTVRSLLQAGALGGWAFEAIVASWSQRHPMIDFTSYYNANAELQLDITFTGATPHMVLLTSKAWSSYMFPFASPKGRLMKHACDGDVDVLTGGRNFRNPVDDSFTLGDSTWGPQEWLSVGNLMRQLLQVEGRPGPLLAEEVGHSVQSIDRMRLALLHQACQAKRRTFKMEQLVEIVVLSGFLRDVSNTKDVIVMALKAVIAEPAQRDYLLGLVRQQRALPSPTTIRRHRLSIHMGYCRHWSAKFSAMMDAPGGLTGWATMDLSPQAGINWCLSARSDAKVSDLERAYDLSQRLGQDQDQDAEIMVELKRIILLRIGTPVGVGSGRQTTPDKMHAFTHESRMSTDSWRRAGH